MSLHEKLLTWLSRLGPSKSPHPTPKGWYIRGLYLLVMSSVLIALWLMSLPSGVGPLKHGWVYQVCPPVTPVTLRALTQHPDRYRGRFIWLIGTLSDTQRHCLKKSCPPTAKSCCQPCLARLQLGRPPHAILLDGLLRLPGYKVPLSVRCRDNSCQPNCRPFQLGKRYAFAGKPRLQITTDPHTGRPRFHLRSFFVHRLCRP